MIQIAKQHTVRVPDQAVRYAEEVRRRLGNHVKQIVLFGSHARGDASESSDYDFVIVLDRKDRALRDKVVDAGACMLDKTDALFAALVYGVEEWSDVQASPLGWNIEREGVLL